MRKILLSFGADLWSEQSLGADSKLAGELSSFRQPETSLQWLFKPTGCYGFLIFAFQ